MTGEEKELEEKDETQKMSWMFPHGGTCSHGSTVSAVWYVV